MFSPKTAVTFLVVLAFSCTLVCLAALAEEKKGTPSSVTIDLQPTKIRVPSKQLDLTEGRADIEPTEVNWWKAKQAGDLEKAGRIRAILDEKARETLRSPSYDIVPLLPVPVPPQRDGEAYRHFIWGNDVSVAEGSVSGGISIECDAVGNMYAVRCTTYLDSSNAGVRIYKSTDGGASWFVLYGFGAPGGTYRFSYPTVVTGSSGDKLYVFYLRSDQNGNVGVARMLQDGTWEGAYDVKADDDTITYFTACGDYGAGDTLVVAYQKKDSLHRLYTISSTDYGAGWGNECYVDDNAAHPDIAYGRNGYVYLVWEKIAPDDSEIWFFANSNFGAGGFWMDLEHLTDDTFDDRYPKVAALHTLPPNAAYLWSAYHKEVKKHYYLQYDDDAAVHYFTIPDKYGDDFFNVRFTAPGYDVKLLTAEFFFYFKTGTGPVRFYVWQSDGTFPTTKIDSVDVQHGDFPALPNLVVVDLSSKNIVVNNYSDFHIGYHPLGPVSTDTVAIISDDGVPEGGHRSVEYYGGVWGTMFDDWGADYNFMIRAEVEANFSDNKDLHFAYSTNGGVDWSKNHVAAESEDYDEMACDLWVRRDEGSTEVHLSYLKFRLWIRDQESYVHHGFANTGDPTDWHSPAPINDHLGAWDFDGRKVSQGTFTGSDPGILYGGMLSFPFNFEDLYFDNSSWVDVEEETAGQDPPAKFSLARNCPNPFNPATRIEYTVHTRQAPLRTTLKIYNIRGRLVRTLVDESKVAGTHEVTWDGRDEGGNEVASGVYLYRLQAGDFDQTKKMVLMK
jgi:hypothetical protein